MKRNKTYLIIAAIIGIFGATTAVDYAMYGADGLYGFRTIFCSLKKDCYVAENLNCRKIQSKDVANKMIDYCEDGNKNPVNGVVIEYSDNSDGMFIRKSSFEDGLRHGFDNSYLPNGNPIMFAYNMRGLLNGGVRTYYPNKKLKKFENYSKGSLQGEAKSYFPNGNIETEDDFIKYDPFDKCDYKGTEYYEDGEVKRKDVRNNGVGEATLYYHDGKLQGKIPYKNCQKNGLAIFYYPDGNIESTVSFENDVMEGETKKFYEDGIMVKAVVQYSGGKRIGRAFSYYSDGELKETAIYVDDRLHDHSFHGFRALGGSNQQILQP